MVILDDTDRLHSNSINFYFGLSRCRNLLEFCYVSLYTCIHTYALYCSYFYDDFVN